MIVLDTNVLSELFLPLPSENVMAWLAAQKPTEVFTTTITQAEILYGVESMPRGKRRTRIENAAERIFAEEFPQRILPFDSAAAREYAAVLSGRTAKGRPISQSDAMIAAVARSHHAAVATRNTKDFEFCGISLINPWTA